MADTTAGTTSRESAKALAAFADYVALGPGRSLERLAEAYQSRTDPGPTRQLSQLKQWSADHRWQERVKALEAARLAAGQERRTALYLRVLDEYDRRTADGAVEAMPIDALHALYDRVRPADRAGAELSIDLTATVELVGVEPGDV